MTQGAVSQFSGGNFGSGFLRGVISKSASYVFRQNFGEDYSSDPATVIGSTIFVGFAGGLAAAASGNDFVRGAYYSSIAHLYNDCFHGQCGTTDGNINPEEPRYGNFTGKGHTDDDQYPNPADSRYLPIDRIDGFSQEHDIDFYNNNIEWSPGKHSNYKRHLIDQKYLNSLNSLNPSSLTYGQKNMIRFINWQFKNTYEPE